VQAAGGVQVASSPTSFNTPHGRVVSHFWDKHAPAWPRSLVERIGIQARARGAAGCPSLSTRDCGGDGCVAGVSAHEAVGALREVGATIASLLPWQAATESNTLEGVPGRVQPLPNGERPCKLQRFGSGWGGHTLCARRYANHGNRGETRRGLALSYGISSDYSFDEADARSSSCGRCDQCEVKLVMSGKVVMRHSMVVVLTVKVQR